MNDHDDENENEDPDWEALAREGERAEAMGRINDIATRIVNSPSLDVTRQHPQSRLVVCPHCQEEDDPQKDEPVEFTILDPATLADFKKMLDLTINKYKGKANFIGAWVSNRNDAMPISFNEKDIKLFSAEANDGTRVTLVHTGWEQLGEMGPAARMGYEHGWDSVLQGYIALAAVR
jgi:hypothetical protein